MSTALPSVFDPAPARGRSAPDVAAWRGPRGGLVWVLFLIFLAGLPDAMVPPVLEGLFVERYGVSDAAAHWFMAVNLVGAVLTLPALAALRRLWPPAAILAGAAFANAAMLAIMAQPIGFIQSLILRVVEGGADLMVLAVLFDLVAKAGPAETRGRRFGLAGTVLLLAIAVGLITGGILGHDRPTIVFWLGAAGAGAIGALAIVSRSLLHGVVRACPAVDALDGRLGPHGLVWPAAAMTFGDRMLAGILTATAPLYLASLGMNSSTVGRLLGVQLLIMALGACVAGRVADRHGHVPVRGIATVAYAVGLGAMVVVAKASEAWLMPIMGLTGCAGAALMPTAFAIGNAGGRGAVGMGQLHAAGNLGYFAGIAGAAILLSTLAAGSDGPSSPSRAAAVILTFIGAYLIINGVGLAGVLITRNGSARHIPAES